MNESLTEIQEAFEALYEYFEHIVKPTVDEYLKADLNNIRRACLACIVIEHIEDYIRESYEKVNPDANYTERQQYPEISLIKDVGDATKHFILTRSKKKRNICNVHDIAYRPHEGASFFNAPFSEATFNNEGIYVTAKDGRIIKLSIVICKVMKIYQDLIDAIREYHTAHYLEI